MKDGTVVHGRLIERASGYVRFDQYLAGVYLRVWMEPESEVRSVVLADGNPAPAQLEFPPPAASTPTPAHTPTSVAGPQPAGRERLEIAPEQLAAVRAQWRLLAPYACMRTELEMVDADAAWAMGAVDKLAELSLLSFDAHPLLAEAGPPLITELAELASAVYVTIDPFIFEMDTPEGVIANLLALGVTERGKMEAWRQWQTSRDRASRTAFKRLLPIIEALAGEEDESLDLSVMSMASDGLPVVLRNDSDVTLTNATICLTLGTLGDQYAEHYFFVERWERGGLFMPRAAGDWVHVGLWGTTVAILRVYADEASVRERRFQLRENADAAADRVIAVEVERDPVAALRMCNEARRLAQSNESRGKIDRIALAAETIRDARRAALEAERSKINAWLDDPPEISRRDDRLFPGRGRTRWDSMTREEFTAARSAYRRRLREIGVQLAALR